MIYGNPAIHGQPALKELFDLCHSLCHGAWDPKEVYLGPAEWAEEIVMGVVRIAVAGTDDEESMNTKFKIGDRVRRCDGVTGVATQNGEVLINSAWLVKVEDFAGLESPIDVENMKRLAELVMVRWYYQDGTSICTAWHSPEHLETRE